MLVVRTAGGARSESGRVEMPYWTAGELPPVRVMLICGIAGSVPNGLMTGAGCMVGCTPPNVCCCGWGEKLNAGAPAGCVAKLNGLAAAWGAPNAPPVPKRLVWAGCVAAVPKRFPPPKPPPKEGALPACWGVGPNKPPEELGVLSWRPVGKRNGGSDVD
jgi:hypothetical protein